MRGRYPCDRSKRNPPQHAAGAWVRPLRADRSDREASAADVAADDFAKQIPFIAVELLQLKLGKRRKIGRAGIDLDARQQAAELQTTEAGRLLHHVLAGEVFTAR